MMTHIRTRDTLEQQRLNQELADVLMAISAMTRSIAKNLYLLNVKRKSKGANLYAKR